MVDLNSLNLRKFDVVVVGGGMVGATQAIALQNSGLSVLLLEQRLPQKTELSRPPLRVSAVNLASEALLLAQGIWPSISDNDKCRFDQLATWEHRDNKLVFDASAIGKPHLGYLVRNEAIQLAAFAKILNTPDNPIVLSDASLISLKQSDDEVTMTLTDSGTDKKDKPIQVHAKLVIGADGAFSKTRKLAHIGSTGWEYKQHCFSITIKTDFVTQNVTWQEFQQSGPKAFLPLENGYACLIWYDSPKTIAQLKTLTPEQLKQQILACFPPLAGDFNVVTSASFPLVRRQANQYVNGRVVLVGDAAHVINPLAGQGVNLGFKDVATLMNILNDTDLANSNLLMSSLRRYQLKRKADAQIMSGVMDLFYHSFSNQNTVVKSVRNLVLSAVHTQQWIKAQALKKAVGI